MSALFGIQPEFDLEPNETLYGAIRYDEAQRSLKSIIKATYFSGLDIIPGNLELQEFEHETPRALTSASRSTDKLFFTRVASALKSVEDHYDIVVLDCPFAWLPDPVGTLCRNFGACNNSSPNARCSINESILAHDRWPFDVVERAGGNANYDWFRYVLTRYEPNDGSQSQIAGLLKGLFGDRVLTNSMVKSAAISDAGITKQTLYEVGRENFHRQTYDRAIEALDAVNHELEELVRDAWGRK